jgi:hypothetical protein
MLGQTLADPEGIDGAAHHGLQALSLLPLHTCYAAPKRLRSAGLRFGALQGAWAPLSGLALQGYEIRCGHTEGPAPIAHADDGQPIAWQQGSVLGIYAHGLFEQPAFLQALFGRAAPHVGPGPGPPGLEPRRRLRRRHHDPSTEALTMTLLNIAPLNEAVRATRVQGLLDRKTKPLGALGRIEALGCSSPASSARTRRGWHSRSCWSARPTMACPHAGVSAYPREVSWQMVLNMLAGGAAVSRAGAPAWSEPDGGGLRRRARLRTPARSGHRQSGGR